MMFGGYEHFGDVLRRNARISGDRTGIVFEEVRLTWREVNARANRLASALQRRGLRHGDRVALLSQNCHQYVEILFGLAKIGVVSVPINYRLSEKDIDYICSDAGATMLISGPDYHATSENVADRSNTIREVVGIGPEVPRQFIAYESLIKDGAEAEPHPDRPIQPEDLLVFLYTSGTTGFPKGVMYTHRRTLMGMSVHVYAIGSHSSHRVMLPAPPYSAAGIAGIFCAVYVGSHTALVNFTPERVLETIQTERITFTNLVPTTIQMLSSRDDLDYYDLSSLKLLLYGGAPMPEPVMRRAAELFRCDFRQTFATSETGCAGTVLEPYEHRLALDDPRRIGLISSCGRPQCNVLVRVASEAGEEVSPGEVGEISIYCDGNMVGYWNNPEATAAALRDGWVYTGDLATVDEQGYIYLVDRKNDMIVTGALNVYPSEVERVLYQHPDVFECAVIGVPHPVWGEAIKAVVVLKEESTVNERDLIAFCKEHLANYKAPKSVDVADRLPRNLTGKVLRKVLRKPYWTGAGQEGPD